MAIVLLFPTLSIVNANIDDDRCDTFVDKSCPRRRVTRCCGGVLQGSYVRCNNNLVQVLEGCNDPSEICQNIPSGIGVECVKIEVVQPLIEEK